MALINYNYSWVGIDAGREGLWKEPIWTGVLKIVSEHTNERVYDPFSQIYLALENKFPKETWRSQTSDGKFRPLFRDYPNSWTRPGVISLEGQLFNITETGRSVLSGTLSKSSILINMFSSHTEIFDHGTIEKPFHILCVALMSAPRALSTEEIYWAIMKNFRPEYDDLTEILKKKLPLLRKKPEATPYRRLRNMLSLMRTANILQSVRRGSCSYWSVIDHDFINHLG